jgi:hypothetical protein
MAELARDLARTLRLADPVGLARAAGIAPDPWQAEVLESGARQLLLNCSRQAGKSTVAALLASDEVLNRPPALVLLIAPALRQAQELHRKVRGILSALAVKLTAESALALELANGSRVVTLPGSEKTVRSYSGVTLLVLDEAARIEDALYHATRPMLATSGGRLMMLSTPWGRRGVFYEAWAHGGADWHRVRLPATACPRIGPDWLEAERQTLPAHVFAQEYMCEFADTAAQVFGSELVEAALSDAVLPLFGRAA